MTFLEYMMKVNLELKKSLSEMDSMQVLVQNRGGVRNSLRIS